MNWKILDQPLGMGNLSGGYAPRKKRFFVIPAIMAAAAIGSAVYGGIQSSRANKKAQAQVDAERALNQAERRRKMYESPFDRADGQNLLRIARQEADKIWKREQGAAAVNGSTESAKQMAKDAGNQMVGNTIANVVANDAARKDEVDAQYRQTDKQLAQQQIGLQQQAGQIRAQAASQVSSALMNAATQYMGASMGAGSPGGGGVTAPKLSTMGTINNNWQVLNPSIKEALQTQALSKQLGYQLYNF